MIDRNGSGHGTRPGSPGGTGWFWNEKVLQSCSRKRCFSAPSSLPWRRAANWVRGSPEKEDGQPGTWRLLSAGSVSSARQTAVRQSWNRPGGRGWHGFVFRAWAVASGCPLPQVQRRLPWSYVMSVRDWPCWPPCVWPAAVISAADRRPAPGPSSLVRPRCAVPRRTRAAPPPQCPRRRLRHIAPRGPVAPVCAANKRVSLG